MLLYSQALKLNVEVIKDEIYFSLICPGKEHIFVVGKCSGIEKESSLSGTKAILNMLKTWLSQCFK